ncbi:MAG TPA: oxidative damage protection protein [Myxococcales bacterium LLY-WYZ-16_1]|nr:oxidative damage protection protein [Myxococcales bacterium LLY-WYZ-16_1]
MDLERISAEEAKRRTDEDGWILLDVRSMPEFVEEHAAGAYNVPFLHKTPNGMVPNPDFARVIEFLLPDKDAKVITHCQMGGRSVRAAMELKHLGYTQVVDMRGGFGSEKADDGTINQPGWKDSGLPVETGEPADRSYKGLALRMNEGDGAASSSEGGEVEAPAGEPPPPVENEGLNRYANPERKVHCIRYGRELPGMKRRPYPGDLGRKLFDQVSAAAWNDWVEHSKMLINEYRINAADPQALKVLMEQCEEFFYGQGVARPEGYVPQS